MCKQFNLTRIARLRAMGPIPLYIDGVLIKKIPKRKLLARLQKYTERHIPKKLTRFQLAVLVVFHKELIAVQTSFRRKQLIQNNTVYHNDACPFTLDTPESPLFIRTTSSGYRRAFNISMLADYFILNGMTVDPVDKEAFEHEDLVRLDNELKIYGLNKQSITDINTDERQVVYRQQQEEQDQVDILRDEIYNCIQIVCQVVDYAHELGAQIDDTEQYPCFKLLYQYVSLLFGLDNNACAIILHALIDELEDGLLYPDFKTSTAKEWVKNYITCTLTNVSESHLNNSVVSEINDIVPWFEITTAQIEPIIVELRSNMRLLNDHYALHVPVIVYDYTHA